VRKIPIPVRDLKSSPLLQVVRSFDVNQPGDPIDTMKGGVAGGTLKRGVLKLGQHIEIRPGLIRKINGELQCYPIVTEIRSLYSEKTPLDFAIPGGLIAIGTTLDPTLCKADRLVGQIIGEVGKLPEVYCFIDLNCFLMRRLLGKESEESIKIKPLEKGEILQVNVGSTSTQAKVHSFTKGTSSKGHVATIELLKPCCAEIGEMVSLSRSFDRQSFRLIGFGVISKGAPLKLVKLTPKNKDFDLS